MPMSRNSTALEPTSIAPALGVLDTGSVRLRLLPRRPAKSFNCRARYVSALLYEMAAALELRSAEMGASWVVSVYPTTEIVIEVVSRRDTDAAVEALMETLAALGYETIDR